MKRLLTVTLALVPAFAATAFSMPVHAEARKDSVTIGMVLEPPGLDPTTAASAAIGEITHYNIYEGLMKADGSGKIDPLLAKSWSVSADLATYTFALRAGVRFQDGEAFTSADVKFSFERAAATDSTNKDKAFFATFAKIETPDPATIAITLKQPDPDFLFKLALPNAIIVDAKSAPGNATKPVGTGPYRLESWAKGASVTLAKWDGYRDPAKIAITKATFRIINDPSAQVAALLAGDIDAFPRFGAFQSMAQFQADPRFAVTIGGTEGKTILAINNKRKPFDDVRVRRAIAHALDRKSIIDGAMNGFGAPIGSHYVPIDPGYVDLTGTFPFDIEKAKALLAEAGVAVPLNVTLTLPPPAYARQGGEIIAAQLAKIGINAKIENVEWAQWLSGTFKGKNFDLTVISHVEPMDLAIYANPDYYFQYDSGVFRDILAKVAAAAKPEDRLAALGEAQRQLANDAVNGYLFQLAQISVADKRLKGLWKDSPFFANDLSVMKWE